MKKGTRSYNVLDLFSGAGGLSLGFTQAGFSVVGAVEFWAPAVLTFEKNHPSTRMIHGDIRSSAVQQQIYELHLEKNIDVVIGGFPCQGFSMAGNRDPLDSRSQLYQEYLKVVAALRPKLFLMENVKGLASMKVIPPDLPGRDVTYLQENLRKIKRYKDLKRYKAQRDLDDKEACEFDALKDEVVSLQQEIEAVRVPLLPIIEDEIRTLGYKPKHEILNATNHGSAQNRERIFIVAIRNDITKDFTFPSPSVSKPVTARERIADLENIPDGSIPNHDFTDHNAKFVKRLAKVKPGETLYKYSDAWWRLLPDAPSRTVKENHGAVFIHYNKNRVITPREMARLQDFPDEFVFEGSKSLVLKQIGNAVPVRLSNAMAESIKKYLDARGINTDAAIPSKRNKEGKKKTKSQGSSISSSMESKS